MTTQTGLGWPTETTTTRASLGLGWPSSTEPPRIAVSGEALVAVDAHGGEIDSADVTHRLGDRPDDGDVSAPAVDPVAPVMTTDEDSVTNSEENAALAADEVEVGRGMETADPGACAPLITTDDDSETNAAEKTEAAAGSAARSRVDDAEAADTVGEAAAEPLRSAVDAGAGGSRPVGSRTPDEASSEDLGGELSDATAGHPASTPAPGSAAADVDRPNGGAPSGPGPDAVATSGSTDGASRSAGGERPSPAGSSATAASPALATGPARKSRSSAFASAWDDKPAREVADRALFGEDGEGGRQVLAEAAAALSPEPAPAVSRETLLTERPVGAIPTIDLPVAERSREGAGSLVDEHLSGRARAKQAAEAARAAALKSEQRAELKAAEKIADRPDDEPLPVPRRTRILTVANQKGGVGKTTTTVNVAAALAKAGLKVLVIDLDPQGNASTALGVPHGPDVSSVYDVLVDGHPLADIVQECPDVAGLQCAPATIDLAGAEIELVSLVAREMRLGRALAAYLRRREDDGDRVDYVLIDCPPSLGLLTINAFVAAEEVFIPIQCEYYALEGLSQLLKNIELIKAHLNPTLHVSTILLTMFDGRTRLSSQVADEVRRHFGPQVVKSMVPRSVRISEAPSHGQTVITYDPTSSGALSYTAAAAEIAEAGASQEGHAR